MSSHPYPLFSLEEIAYGLRFPDSPGSRTTKRRASTRASSS